MTSVYAPGEAGVWFCDLPRLAEGTELAGEFAGSGYREPPLLVYRGDGQAVKLPALLYLTVKALDEAVTQLEETRHGGAVPADRDRVLEAVARAVSAQTGRTYASEHVAYLLDKKLAPLGLTTYADGSPPEDLKAQPFLSLNLKLTMLTPRATWAVAGLFSWLFRTPVLCGVIAAIIFAEGWAFGTQHVTAAMEQTLGTPASVLIVMLLAIASTGFHEIGHGTACRYGGVRPGATGCGIYVAWPVFYTDITNSYRLDRAGRLRTDLAGVYFNGIFIVALAVAYWATGYTPLLAGLVSTNLEIVQQLLPTLRFDGYYVISDLVGIPDLFKYIGPILGRTLFRRPPDASLAALRRWPQLITTIWVLCVVPVLLGQLVLLAVNLPDLVRGDWAKTMALAASAQSAGSPVLGVASATIQILFLLVPLIGVAVLVYRLARWLARFGWRRARAGYAALSDALRSSDWRSRGVSVRLAGAGMVAAAMVGIVGTALMLSPSVRQGTMSEMQPAPLAGAGIQPVLLNPPVPARPQAPPVAGSGASRPKAGSAPGPTGTPGSGSAWSTGSGSSGGSGTYPQPGAAPSRPVAYHRQEPSSPAKTSPATAGKTPSKRKPPRPDPGQAPPTGPRTGQGSTTPHSGSRPQPSASPPTAAPSSPAPSQPSSPAPSPSPTCVLNVLGLVEVGSC